MIKEILELEKYCDDIGVETRKETLLDGYVLRFNNGGDVVPRSEVDKIFDKYGNYNFPTEPKEDFNNTVVTGGYVIDWYKEAGLNAKRIMELEAELTKAKQEVARKIFEDFTKHKVCTNEEDYRVLAELKKKYIGE